MFFCVTRFDPERAGTSATHAGNRPDSARRGIEVGVARFPPRLPVKRLGPGFPPPGPGTPHPAERHVRLTPEVAPLTTATPERIRDTKVMARWTFVVWMAAVRP